MHKFLLAITTIIFFTAPLVGTHASQQTTPVEGEVEKINESTGKITLKHGPITNLGMGAMTMMFPVKDPEMLKAVHEGDQVIFEADLVDGAIIVTAIRKNE